jgi:hypothetical protein
VPDARGFRRGKYEIIMQYENESLECVIGLEV